MNDHPCCTALTDFKNQLDDLKLSIRKRQLEIWRYFHDGQITPYEMARQFDALINGIVG